MFLARRRHPNWPNPPITIAALLIAALGYLLVKPVDLKGGELGTPVAGLMVAIACSHLVLFVCRELARLPKAKAIFSELGRASLVVLFLHLFFVNRMHVSLSPVILVFLGIFVPYLCFKAMSHAGPTTRFLFLGAPLPGMKLIPVAQKSRPSRDR